MNVNAVRTGLQRRFLRWAAVITCSVPMVIGGRSLFAKQEPNSQENVKIPLEQLDSLVAPIALYPDPMLSQTLVASTYPLELMQLQQWLDRNKGLKDKALVDAVSKQPWDPSVQAMAALPDLVKRLTDDIQWTTDLGNAFLSQQSDVMDAVQRMRTKAQGTGALVSNEHQKVETEVVQDKNVIVIEQANPEVVYVPSYNPEAVYGAPAYPYPSIYYPSYYPGTLAASAISFGVGAMMGAAWGGGWGWGAGWGGNDIDMNFNNSFNRNNSINRGNVAANRGGNKWQHNPQHRGGAPYSNRATANQFGGTSRGSSLSSRQKTAQQQINRQKGSMSSANRAGAAARTPGGGVNRGAGGGVNRGAGGGVNRGAGGGVSRSGGGASRSGSYGMSPSRGGMGGGADRIGNRNLGSSSVGNRGGFSGGSGGYNRNSARSSRSRGSSSMRSGGGRSRGGGGGGRSRGGGGGGRSRGGGGGGRRR